MHLYGFDKYLLVHLTLYTESVYLCTSFVNACL